mgnify:CR=1 FL=1
MRSYYGERNWPGCKIDSAIVSAIDILFACILSYCMKPRPRARQPDHNKNASPPVESWLEI